MECEAIRPLVRTFLDDLLDEKDYQDIHAHLTSCARCNSYASSVGTLSYRLYELGRVSVPPDMVSTVLYEYDSRSRKLPEENKLLEERAQSHAAVATTNKLFWAAFCLILVVSITAVAAVMGAHRIPKKENVPLKNEFSDLQSPAASTQPSQAPKENYAHWHYHVSKSSQLEVANFFKEAGIQPIEDFSAYMVCYVPKTMSEKFVDFMTTLSGVVKEFGEIDPSRVSGEQIQVSIYFE